MKKLYLFIAFVTSTFCLSKAQTTYFQQNFSAGGNTSDYVSTSPNTGQFNGLAGLSATITNNAVQFTRPTDSGTGHMSRSTNFAGPPTSLHVQFSFEVISNDLTATGTSAVIFYVGSAFNSGPQNPSNAETYARIGFNFSSTTSGQFQVRTIPAGGGGANSASFSGRQTITFAMNNTGSNNVKYVSPTGAMESLADDTYDVWVGTTKVFNDQPVITPTQNINNFKFRINNGIGVVQIGTLLMRDISGTLPVELVSFTAKPAGKHVQLAWSTTSERDAARFVVERSSDLKEYTTVGEVAAKGTTDQRQYYGLTDESPLTGNNYYRLRQVDTDGSMQYSKIVAAVMDDETPSFELRGNPVDRNAIQLVSRNLTNATYQLTTLTGQELAVRAEPQADQSLLLTPAQGLAPGVYLLRAQQGATRLVRKVVVR